MERRIVIMATLVVALGACSAGEDAPARPADAPAASAWVQPPRIDAISPNGASLIVRGVAEPGARVVLRGADGAAAAVAADSTGRFELRIPAPPAPVLMAPEVQLGEDAAVSPDTLVVIPGGPAALIAAGEATRRLDRAGPLEAVDFDGAAVQMVGRMADGAASAPTLVVDGAPLAVMRLPNGRWRAVQSGGAAREIVVGGRAYAYPGAQALEGEGVARAGQGWRVAWVGRPSGRQVTWLPD